jgi:hypothetical protein
MITQARLKELLNYDPETGVFTWAIRRPGVCFEKTVGNINVVYGKKYLRIKLDRTPYAAHRLAWLYMTADPSPVGIDHEDGNGLNNKFDNLREATHLENMRNMRLNKRNTSGVCGIYWEYISKNWTASISSCGKSIHLGRHKDKFEAICARKPAENKLGFHVNHGQDRPL